MACGRRPAAGGRGGQRPAHPRGIHRRHRRQVRSGRSAPPDSATGEAAAGLPMSSQCPQTKPGPATVRDLKRTESAGPVPFGERPWVDRGRLNAAPQRPPSPGRFIGPPLRDTAPVQRSEGHRCSLKVPRAGPGRRYSCGTRSSFLTRERWAVLARPLRRADWRSRRDDLGSASGAAIMGRSERSGCRSRHRRCGYRSRPCLRRRRRQPRWPAAARRGRR